MSIEDFIINNELNVGWNPAIVFVEQKGPTGITTKSIGIKRKHHPDKRSALVAGLKEFGYQEG